MLCLRPLVEFCHQAPQAQSKQIYIGHSAFRLCWLATVSLVGLARLCQRLSLCTSEDMMSTP